MTIVSRLSRGNLPENTQVARKSSSSQKRSDQPGARRTLSGQKGAKQLESADQLGGAAPSEQGVLQRVRGEYCWMGRGATA